MKKNNKGKPLKFRFIAILWGGVIVAAIIAVVLSEVLSGQFKQYSYSWITIIITFASFIATSFFSISIYNHNAIIRDMNNEIRNQTNAVNKRAEAFRNLQFVASNYTIVDFVDNMTIYSEPDRYRNKLKKTKMFEFYLLEQGINKDDVIENFDNYKFLTVKIPVKIIEGKAIGKITFSRFKFEKEEGSYRFLPPEGTAASKSLILYNENDMRSEALINLIMKSDSEFYAFNELNPFLKIKIDLSMESLLGVVTSGSIELYFTNPEKIERASGANKYKINSSQFELSGMPKLCIGKEYEID